MAAAGKFSITKALALAFLYLAAAYLEKHLTFPHDLIVLVRPSAGIGLFCLLWLGLRAWPFVAAPALLAAVLAQPSLTAALGVAAGHTAGALAAAVLIRRLAGEEPVLSGASRVLAFALGAVAGAAPGAVLGVAALGLYDPIYFSSFAANGLNWWLGDVAGALSVTPVLMAWTHAGLDPPPPRKKEGAALFLTLSLVLAVIFAGALPIGVEDYPLVYLIFPFLLWAVFRFEPRVSLGALLLIAAAALAGTLSGQGPFVRETVSETVPLLQSFLIVAAMAALIMAAALGELRQAREGLEQRVAERTEELARAKQEAEDATQAKSRFLAAASHDLRQPLHAMGLFVAALDRRIRDPENRGLLDKLRVSAAAAGEMLNTLLDLSRIEAKALPVEVKDFPLGPMLARMEADFSAQAEDKGLAFKIVPCSLAARSDPAMLERIVRNFVANAIRYTDAGRVLAGCRRQGGDISLQVWDTGPGIPADQVEEIFREYHQLGNPERDRRHGLGLGLAIVDGLARLLDHPVKVDSTVGKGSLFAIRVPQGAHMGDAPGAIPRDYSPQPVCQGASLEGLRALVIDDDPDVLDGMKAALEGWGAEALLAGSGAEAEKLIAGAGWAPDVILADYRLRDGETGIQAIARIDAALGREIPGVIITGDAQASKLKEIEDSPHHLLHKPVRPASLRPLLLHIMKG